MKSQWSSWVILNQCFTKKWFQGKIEVCLGSFFWEDHDINGSAKGFEICVHVFGGTSFPSFCNYALKQTAYGNKSRYQTDVTDTLNRNFYMDDLLKSVKDVYTAIRLLHNVISMCADGGFQLAKFVSN